jgi:hypothetical protein
MHNYTLTNSTHIVLNELVAIIKGFGHAVVIPFVIFWITFEFSENAEGSLLLMVSYLLLPISLYEYYSMEDGEWLKSQKWFYAFVFLITCVILSIILRNSNIY